MATNHQQFFDGMDGFISASEIKQRGWSETMIKRFLKPCGYVTNPHYPTAHKARIYKVSEVEQAELSDNLHYAKVKSKVASARGILAAKTKEQKAIAFAMSIRIPLNLDRDAMRKQAMDRIEREGQIRFHLDNDLLYQHTLYEILLESCAHANYALDEMYQTKGVVSARRVLNDRIHATIEKNYPELKMICELKKQQREKNE